MLEGVAAPLKIINIDTDMIIPKQFLKTIKRTGLGKGLFSEKRYQRRRQREPGFRAQQAGLSQGQDSGRRRQFRLRVVARACALGADGFRHPLRDLDLVRRYFLQQLLQERRPADPVSPEDLENCSTTPSAAPTRRCRRSRKQEIRGPDGGMVKFDIDRAPQALSAQRPRRHRPDHGQGDKIDGYEAKAQPRGRGLLTIVIPWAPRQRRARNPFPPRLWLWIPGSELRTAPE